jgi:hypothetical protein
MCECETRLAESKIMPKDHGVCMDVTKEHNGSAATKDPGVDGIKERAGKNWSKPKTGKTKNW